MGRDDYARTLATLKEIVKEVSYAVEAGSLEEALERIAEAARQLVNARYAALGIPDSDKNLRFFKFAGMSDEDVAHIGHLPEGKGLLGAIMHERRVIRLNNMDRDPRSVGFPDHHPAMNSFLGVPIQVGSELFGMLYLADRMDGQPFSDHDQYLIEAIAGYAALAIAGAQMRQQQNRINLLEERERIAMDLHDSIIQDLYAIGMQLDLARQADMFDSEQVTTTIQSLNTVIDDIRDYIMDLRSTSFGLKTLDEAMHDVVKRLHIPQKVDVVVNAPASKPPITAGAYEALCQITHEAISNAVRHGKPCKITVQAGRENNHIYASVRDDGCGFNMDEYTRIGGLGLHNIQRRASLHGGSVTIESTPNQGTIVTARMPSVDS